MKAIALLLAIVAVAAQAQDCSWTAPDGKAFDLTEMKSTTDYQAEYSDGTTTYVIYSNICGTATKTTNAGQSVATVQYDKTKGTFVSTLVKTWSAPQWSYIDANDASQGIKASFANGDVCPNGQARSVVFYFKCTSGAGVGSFTKFLEPTKGSCKYEADFATEITCPGGLSSGGGLSGGWVFIIILIVGTVVYCAGGVIYKRQKLGVVGTEAIPNIDFWKELPSLVKDGISFTVGKCRGGSTSTESYEHI